MKVANSAGTAVPISWDEQLVPLAAIIKHKPFQVRKALDKAAVRRYGEMTRAGKIAPPIKVALIRGSHYLLDGWHRMAAGALTTAGADVLALVASMTDKQAMWEAANANTGHGVPLKAAEIRGLFRAFIRSGQHKKAKGQSMSYREMQAALGKPHTTLRNWVREDFPKLFASLRADDVGNPSPIGCNDGLLSLDQQRIEQAQEAARTIQQIGDVLTTADARGDLVVILETTLRKLRESGGAISVSDF
jgi:hypothetical protein